MKRAFTLLFMALACSLVAPVGAATIPAPVDPAISSVGRAGVATYVVSSAGSIPARGANAGTPTPSGAVGTAIYSASATWCAPTPTQCQDWGGNARLAAVNSFRFGDEPYWVRITRGDASADALVVSHCACHGKHGYIDVSPAVFEQLAPLSRGRIDVIVEVLIDLPPHPDDERMRREVRDPLPATSTVDAVQ